jgi:hypothetical protein
VVVVDPIGDGIAITGEGAVVVDSVVVVRV